MALGLGAKEAVILQYCFLRCDMKSANREQRARSSQKLLEVSQL